MNPAHMKLNFCALLLSLWMAGLAIPGRAEWAPQHWSIMTDAWGTRVDYPSGIFTIEEGAPPRGIGRVLESADNEARLMASRIDYRRTTDRFFAVSGENTGSIFYSRCNFPDGKIGPMHCIFLSYRSSEKEAWDYIVTRISLSLRPRTM
jgi:hypothetical protein